MLTPQDWHRRFTQQALWTESIRQYLYQKMELRQARHALEVGCGSGVITADLKKHTPANVIGLDLRYDFLQFASLNSTGGGWLQGDGLTMPFPAGAFDCACCHYLLLWINNPHRILSEMARVVHPGGYVAALAEPDYGGRIDHPEQLAALGSLQALALAQQGADPNIGRKLNQLFHQAGLTEIEVGLLGGQWSDPPTPTSFESEWAVLSADLAGFISPSELAELKRLDRAAWQTGERILFVPTFYAIGKVPSPD